MRKLTYLLTSYLLILNFSYSFSQDDYSYLNFNNTIIPPTPEVASLGKYIETPVNEFTGIPRIGIPIYNIEQNRINHSINLSYHAQGVKVEEIASRVGMGWTLNAGGVIHRQKRKLPDESRYGYLRTSETVEELSSVLENSFSCSTHEYVNSMFFRDQQFRIDFEPDVFNFSFGSYSGTFYYDQKTGEPVLEESSSLKIEWIGYDYFIITTPDGIEYYFGSNKGGTKSAKIFKGGSNVEEIHTTGKFGSSIDETDSPLYERYVATWHLLEIYDPISDNNITFKYEVFDLGKLPRRLSSSVVTEELPNANRAVIWFKNQVSTQKEIEYVLSEINFDNGIINFISEEEDRDDLSGSHALKQILVSDINSKKIKSFGFDYFYSENSKGGRDVDIARYYNDLDDINFRLFLSGIKEYKINNIKNTIISDDYKSHDFVYKNTNRLPHRFSTAQDFWGFHNNASDNKNLSPYDNRYLAGNASLFQLGEADRKINESYSQDGVLTKITYPTKGTTEYIYENNRVSKVVPIDAFCENRWDPIFSNISTEKIGFDLNENNVDKKFPNGGMPYYRKEFTLDDISISGSGSSKQIVEFTFNNYYENITNPNETDHWWDSRVEVLDKATNRWLRVRSFNINGVTKVDLDPGEYRIMIEWEGENGTEGPWDKRYHEEGDWRLTFDIIGVIEEVKEDYILTGGLRIKEIKNNSLNGATHSIKYSYQNKFRKTTGNLVSLPYRLSNIWYAASSDILQFRVYHEYLSETNIALGTTQGSYTGYEEVTKSYEDGIYGKEEFLFSFERNSCNLRLAYKNNNILGGNEYWASANTLALNQEMQRGKLLSNIKYNKVGNIINKTVNTYDLIDHKEFKAFAVRKWNNTNSLVSGSVIVQDQGPELGLTTTQCTNIDSIINEYSLFSRSNLMTESITSVFDTNGKNPVTTTTNYNYNNKEFPSLQTGSITTNSKGETIESKTYYPDDITGATSLKGSNLISPELTAIRRLQKGASEYRVGQPIQQETYVDNELASIQRTNFSTLGGVTLPTSIEAIIGNENLEEKITYHSYTDNGNPEEISRPDGVHTSYIWGYNNQYPVAKIENASILTVNATLTTTELEKIESGVYTQSQMITTLNKIRTGLPNAMVTTYTYDPLVGVTSVTDPKGYTMYYEYDGFQRLEAVKDADGNLISTNEYNYKN